MRARPLVWLSIPLVCLVGVMCWWRPGGKPSVRPVPPAAVAPVGKTVAQAPFTLLSRAGMLNAVPAGTNAAPRKDYRITNTSKSLRELGRSEKAILLENASLDTTAPLDLNIPDHLRAHGDAGSYIVQARQRVDARFRAALEVAGATYVGYIPNNACLVRASAEVAATLAAQAGLVQVVLPFEPQYKLKGVLLALAVEQAPLPPQTALNILLFPDARADTLAQLTQLGAQVLAEERSPFGTVVKVRPPAESLVSVAGLPGVQEIELAHTRALANDLSRPLMGVATDSLVTTNYLGLTGTNIVIGMNDSGADTNHPDLIGRITSDSPLSGTDTNGHGTHIAGIIMGSGAESSSVTNPAGAQGSIMPATNNQFRGVAPGARLFVSLADPILGPAYGDNWSLGPAYSDSYLQETMARTNILVSNNSWNYSDLAFRSEVATYDLAAANYDAAVRDALPLVSGAQPVLFVFSAGDGGGGDSGGMGGNPDTIQSPATAKNVLTVGAFQSMRQITNQVTTVATSVFTGQSVSNTAAIWSDDTSNNTTVASFSSCGNVGVGIEGDYGRFKPDVMAPGTFIISTRSSEWDQQSYYGYHLRQHPTDVVLAPNDVFVGNFDLPDVTQAINIALVHRRLTEPYPLQQVSNAVPDLPVFVSASGAALPAYDYVGTNLLTIRNPSPGTNPYSYTVLNTSTQTVMLDISVDLTYLATNDNTFQVLSNLNGELGSYYRYESGTSMSAAGASGMLALMLEFLESPKHLPSPRTNYNGGLYGHSPALLKAMLINGARSLGNGYNFQVQNNVNYQGWGKISLPTSIHPGLANESAPTNSMYLVDQDVNNSLATGDSHTYLITVAPEAQQQPLKVTIAWTDPPGNPVAGLKLVNDLNLVVTNLNSVGSAFPLIYFGNDITGVNDYNLPWDTNQVPNVDYVNNVENVFIPPPLATNYSITVTGHRVNVNALSQHTNNIVQDYALVVSCGDGSVTNAMTFARSTTTSANVPYLTTMTNSFVGSDNYYGQTLANQRAGANSPLLGTNTIPLTGYANGVLTLGTTNQWHFYVITNETSFTNARFVLANPIEISVPRMGTEALELTNSTPIVADADLYVSQDPTLLQLNPAAVANAYKALGPSASSAIVLSNANSGAYYIAVQAQDQMAVEYTLQVLFSLLPPASEDSLGGHLPWYEWLAIPTGNDQKPGSTNALLGPNLDPSMLVRRVIVTNLMAHQLMGDIEGVISYADGTFAVLNNHNPDYGVTNGFLYDDSNQGDIVGAVHTDGPGTLKTFAGRRLPGLFRVTEADSTGPQLGNFKPLGIFLERQMPLIAGVTNIIPPNHCTDDYIEVGPQVTSMTISATLLSGSGPIALQVCTLGGVCSAEVTNSPAVAITLNQLSTPPLQPTTYDVQVCNLGSNVAKVYLIAYLTYGQTTLQTTSYATNPLTAIPDDAVSYATLNVTNHLTIESLDVGLLITNLQRVSDLAITLISPSGQRFSLFQDRGAFTTNGLGSFSVQADGSVTPGFVTSALTPFWTNNFDRAAAGPYAPGSLFGTWGVLTNWARVYPTLPAPWLSNNVLLLAEGAVTNPLPGTNAVPLPASLTNTTLYQLTFRVTHAPYLVGMVSWWPFDGDGSDIFGGLSGLTYGDVAWNTTNGEVNQAFFGDGVLTHMMVPRAPALDVGPRPFGFSVQGWIRPDSITNPAPLVEWYDPTNPAPVGVKLWLGDLSSTNPAPGGLSAAFYDTNYAVHYLSAPNAGITNGGWQHIALSYDAQAGLGMLYTNGQIAATQPLYFTNSYPRAVGDLYFGFDPPTPTFAYPNFAVLTNVALLRAAALLGEVVRLTPAVAYTNGMALYNDKQPCAAGFSTFFSFQLGSEGGNPSGGDGVAFFVSAANPRVLGTGLLGAPVKSFAVCFGTVTNVGSNSGNFVGVTTDSATWFYHADLTGLGINLKDGNPHRTSVNYDGQRLSVIVDGVPVISRLAVGISSALDAVGRGFVGLSASTGASWETHRILSWTFSSDAANPGRTYSGGLDEFSLFDRPLTACEVLAIYQAGTNGMYGTNVLWCPMTNSPAGASVAVQLSTAFGPVTTLFTNGLAWTNGPVWETNTLAFTNLALLATTNGPVTNFTGLVLTNGDPNLILDDFVLSAVISNYVSGVMDFSDNTNLALLPVTYAPYPYLVSNSPPVGVFTNTFENAPAGAYPVGTGIPGALGPDGTAIWWTNLGGTISILSNSLVSAWGTNCAVLGMNGVQTLLPTTPGQLYQLTYSVRGPGAVSWWTGDLEPFSQRAWDLIGGNHAAFVYDATNLPNGIVGTNALQLPGIVNPTNGLVSKLEIGDPANLRLTNSFTFEGWFKPEVLTNFTTAVNEQILFRGEELECMQPYFFAFQRYSQDKLDILLHIQDGQHGDCGATLQTINEPVSAGQWQHVAVVFESNVNLTNEFTWPTNEMRIYYNGVQLTPDLGQVGLLDPLDGAGLTATEFTSRHPLANLDPAFSPGVSIGARSRHENSDPYHGEINDFTVYGRALSAEEILEIYNRGQQGKADLTVLPATSLSKLSVTIAGIDRGVVYGENAQWATYSVQFRAATTNTLLTLQGQLPGTLVGPITLATVPSSLTYLPEDSLQALNGQDAYGMWTLEIQDTRSGPGTIATNLLPQLATWQLNFQSYPLALQPTISLEHGMPYTNSLPAHGWQNFVVQVPLWATNATNALLSATDLTGLTNLAVGVLCDTNTFPVSMTNALFWPPVLAPATNILTTNVLGFAGSTPPLLYPGQSYFLTVTNTNALAVTFAVGAWFNLTTLTNCQLLTNALVGPAGIPAYFQFDVPATAVSSNGVPSVAFYLSGVASNYVGFQSNLTVVLSEHLPLPDLTHYDYISFSPRTNDDISMVVSNSTPFAVQTNRWYVGVFNSAPTNVPFMVQACYNTNYPTLVPLTNGVDFITTTAVNTNYLAVPGAPQSFFFEFQITNYVDAVLFELYQLSGQADLVLQRDVPPVMAPYFASSTQPGLQPEQIVVRTSGALPDLRGYWYLGVYSHEPTNLVAYTIRATTSANGDLQSALPLVVTNQVFQTNWILLSWNAVIGDYYTVTYTNGITSIPWTNVLAATPLATALVPFPTNGSYSIAPVPTPTTLRPPLYIATAPGGLLRLSWPVSFTGFTLQSTTSLTPPTWANVTLPVTVEGNYYVVYIPLPGVQTYFRLMR